MRHADEEDDDARPHVEPLAEDELGLVGAHLLDDDAPDRVAGDVEPEELPAREVRRRSIEQQDRGEAACTQTNS